MDVRSHNRGGETMPFLTSKTIWKKKTYHKVRHISNGIRATKLRKKSRKKNHKKEGKKGKIMNCCCRRRLH